MEVGAGKIEANLFLDGDLSGGMAGAAVDYNHRLSESLSTFVRGYTGYGYGDQSGFGYGAMAGLRWRF